MVCQATQDAEPVEMGMNRPVGTVNDVMRKSEAAAVVVEMATTEVVADEESLQVAVIVIGTGQA